MVWNVKYNEYCKHWKEIDLYIDVYHKQHYGIKCLSNLLQLEPCDGMFKVISDIMAHWYEMWNTIVIAIRFCTGKKMIGALLFIVRNHDGIKYITVRTM